MKKYAIASGIVGEIGPECLLSKGRLEGNEEESRYDKEDDKCPEGGAHQTGEC